MVKRFELEQPPAPESSQYPSLAELWGFESSFEPQWFDSQGNRVDGWGYSTLYRRLFNPNGAHQALERKQQHSLYFNETDLFRRPGESWRRGYVNCDIAEFLARQLANPITDLNLLQERQSLIQELMNAPEFEQLHQLLIKALEIIDGVGELRAMPGNGFNDERSLLEYHQGGEKFVKIYEDEYSERVIEKKPVRPMVRSAMKKISIGLAYLTDLWETAEQSQQPRVRHLASELKILDSTVRKVLIAALPFEVLRKNAEAVPTYLSDDSLNKLYHQLGHLFNQVAGLFELAIKFERENWQPVTFDINQPEFFEGGWNLNHAPENQVSNDSPEPSPVTWLAGPNTSGKSYYLQTDFHLRLAAQAFGFAPVASANLHPVTQLLFIDRATSGHNEQLSAFMHEVTYWKKIASQLIPGARLYLDEPFSTTAHADQLEMLQRLISICTSRKVNMVLASHSDLLAIWSDQNLDLIKPYHLATEFTETGRLIRHFRLEPGVADSLSLVVAQANDFSPEALAKVEQYLATQTIDLSAAQRPVFPEIEGYSESDRAWLKTQAYSLNQLIPDSTDEATFQLLSLDPDWQVHRKLIEDSDIFGDFDVFDPDTINIVLNKLIFWKPELSVAEVLERQKMMDELLNDDRAQLINLAIDGVSSFASVLRFLSDIQKRGVWPWLQPFARIKSSEKVFSPEGVEVLHIFLELVEQLVGPQPAFEEVLASARILAQTIQTPPEKKTASELAELSDQIKNWGKKWWELINGLPPIVINDLRNPELSWWCQRLKTWEQSSDEVQTSQPAQKIKGMARAIRDLMEVSSLDLFSLVERLDNSGAELDELLNLLRQTDSVYLHQAANDLELERARGEEQLHAGTYESKLGNKNHLEEVFSDGPSSKKFSHLDQSLNPFAAYFSDMKDVATNSPWLTALKPLAAVSFLAEHLRQQGWSRVEWNSEGVIHFQAVQSLFYQEDEVIRNDFELNPEFEQVKMLTGPNGSGKTFYEKASLAAIMAGLATGYAPAESAQLPLLAGTVYLDRVIQQQSSELSAFAQELKYWEEVLRIARIYQPLLVMVDEGFSTASAAYQEGFTQAMIALLLEQGHLVVFATHNHEVVEHLEAASQLVAPYHFAYLLDQNQIEYLYQLQPGHAPSLATEVAETLGLWQALEA